ncbi:hypothetical protein [Actinokineospora inagensis]|uniref:hypothetical protein n=1 Tax=Actinokineospora inagensis TaxID=103730 RepID=UPI0004224A77|nr:hypothetical protein [Actinokineospora inagensis]
MHVVLVGPRAEVIDALHRDGHETTVLYEAAQRDRVRQSESLIARRCVVDSYGKTESLWSALHHLGVADRVDAVLTANELAVVSTALLGARLGAISVDPQVALVCRDKAIQKARWADAGIPTARWHVLTNGAESVEQVRDALTTAGLKPPLVIKPLAAGGAESVSRADSYAEVFTKAKDNPQLSRLMVEEFLDGPEWHFDGIVEGGRVTDLMVSRYGEPLLTTKDGQPSRSVALPPRRHPRTYRHAHNLTTRAIDALGYTKGVFHFEAFGLPDAFVASELGIRPGGSLVGMTAERVLGVDLWAASVRLFTGDELGRRTVDQDVVHGWFHLPSIPGVPNLVTEDDVRAIPGVGTVVMRVRPGEPMPDMTETTSAGIGFVSVTAPTETECRLVMDKVIAHVRAVHGERLPA